MKLYTEEQVIELLYWISPTYMSREEVKERLKKDLTPIELPSDEKIDEKSNFLFPNANRIGSSTYIAYKGFIEGAIWMKTQILNQNK